MAVMQQLFGEKKMYSNKKTKRNIAVLCVSMLCIIVITFLARFVKNINMLWIRIVALVGLNLLNGIVALIAMKLTRMKNNIDFKNKRQIFIGAIIAISLSVFIAIIPALCGFSLVGGHTDFSWFTIIYNFLFCMLIVGPVEEFVFRVYLQDAFVSFFKKQKWIGVVISSFLFGLWHMINGNIIQVLFTFGIGLVFGFAKYKIKDCGYIGVSFGHGLYDFLNTVVRMFVV